MTLQLLFNAIFEMLLNMQAMLDQWHGLPRFVIGALSLYRLCQLIVYDDGPWDFIQKTRMLLGVYDYSHNGKPKTMIGGLFACPYCIGIWLTVPTALVVFYPTMFFDVVLVLGGLAGVQAHLQSQAKDG